MRLSSAIALVLLLGCHPDAMGPAPPDHRRTSTHASDEHGPPPPQDFGPDTYRTGVFTGEGISDPGLNCGGSSQRGRACTGFLPSGVDGTLLDVALLVPHRQGPHPLVVLLHGWGGSKTSSGDIADALLAEGYAVLRYSARGFGRSWGQVNLADVQVEIEDLKSIVGQIVDHRGFRLDPGAVAIAGASYGGGQSWLALLAPSFSTPGGATVRIRTVVPIVGWSDLLYSLIPNGRSEYSLAPPGSPKLSYLNGLYFAGIRTSEERPYPNYPDYLIAWHAWINAMEPNALDPVYRQIADGVAGYRSVWWQQAFWAEAARASVPVFQIQGLTDDLFPLPEAKRMLLALKTVDPAYPIASYFGDIGHPRASNKPGEVEYVLGLIREWLAYYLQDTGAEPAHTLSAAITRPRHQAFSSADVITAADYGGLATRSLSKEFSDPAILINPTGDPYSAFFWDPLVLEAARELKPHELPPPEPALIETSLAIYRVPVAELTGGASLLISGQPAVSLRASTAAPRVQLNVRLLDIAPDGRKQLVTRGTYMLVQAPSGGLPEAAEVMITTYGNVWESAPDHVLQLEITNLDSPYISPSRVPSATAISEVRLDIPAR